jgi:3-hydroxyacyl-CoA dehydrogenase
MTAHTTPHHGVTPAAPGPVTLQREGAVAVITIHTPPANARTAQVRAGLLDRLAQAAGDASVTAVVLIGSGRHFVSGSDLREFTGELPRPELPEVIAAVEACPKPVVAGLSGSTLGGGFELALACDARVALAGGRVGLPEVTLGMIPGAGGTQRPLRLLPPARVLELVTSGRTLTVEQACAEGLVDLVVENSLREEATSFAGRSNAKRTLREMPVVDSVPGSLEAAASRALNRYGPRPAITAAIGAVLTGVALPAEMALTHEREEFNRLRTSHEAAARRHLFFARSATARGAGGSRRPTISRVGIVGAGTMGTGIARAFADTGVSVTLVDNDPEATKRAKATLDRAYSRSVSQGALTARAAEERLARVETGETLGALAGCDMVIEAVIEDHRVKAEVLTALEAVVGAAVTLGTNTSYLDIDALAGELRDPSRLVGTHFFGPAHRTKVIEVVKGAHTSPEGMEDALAVARVLGKAPVIAGVCDGFIGNRIYNAYRRQCELLVEDGASPEDVDTALTGFGFAMGPFAVSDMSGLDVAWHARRRRDPDRDPRERYPDVADRLVELGRLGQKSSAGWYRYTSESKKPVPDPAVADLIEVSRRDKGISPRPVRGEEIRERALMAMANEAALLLEEGIAERASDVDLLFVHGYGFPAHEGGICFWAAHRNASELRASQQRLAEATGWGFRPGDLSLLR